MDCPIKVISQISLGEILTSLIALLTFIVAIFIGKEQNRINRYLLKIQDFVEIFINIENFQIQSSNNSSSSRPVMRIYNIGNLVIFLSAYTFNGVRYSIENAAIPPVKMFPEHYYYIELPTNGTSHVSFELLFIDSLNKKWKAEGVADCSNEHNNWQIKVSRCKRISK